jgi:hypothetical protein
LGESLHIAQISDDGVLTSKSSVGGTSTTVGKLFTAGLYGSGFQQSASHSQDFLHAVLRQSASSSGKAPHTVDVASYV